MQALKLIREEFLETRVVIEEEKGSKFLCIEGPMLQAEVKNRNGRFYPAPLMEREVNRYVQEKISKGTSWGELGHPNGPGINLDRISHLTTSLKREGNDWIGRARIVDTAPGNTAKKLMEAGGTLGVSSRGLGSLKMDQTRGYQLVQDDFVLCVASDIVADPSAPNAFVRGIMEGVEFFYDATHGTWAQKMLEPVREDLIASTLDQIEEKKTAVFETFLKRLGEPLDEESSAHATFQRYGYVYSGSKDRGTHVEHTYVAAPGKGRFSQLHGKIKEHGFRFASRNDGDRVYSYSHADGSSVTHSHVKVKGEPFNVITHRQRAVKESTIFETEMTQLGLATRSGLHPDEVSRCWGRAKAINEGQGRDQTDYDNIRAIAFRLLGLAS